MPYKYIGRTTDFKGKTLWEILGNLKDFGVGRIVARNMFQRYPEPSYFKILKVEALPNPKKPSYDDQRKVITLVENTFRGIKQQELVQMEGTTYKADYLLVPKHLEAKFCEPKEPLKQKILPATMKFPPIMKEMIIRQMKASGKPVTEEPKMKVVYNLTGIKTYRVAKEGETPTEPELELGVGKTIAPRLYETIEK